MPGKGFVQELHTRFLMSTRDDHRTDRCQEVTA